ncbi:MAG: aminotransferase class V-fold PLP-dependent enzyme [Lachnospiraceae bacterium]|jgi:cysteine desulfurase/selenocysteine lyase
MIYLDNAATSGKKPDEVYEAVLDALKNASGNPGRSGHQVSLRAGHIVNEARLKCARLIGAEEAERIVFGGNATDALNTAIMGIASGCRHIITSSMEHNSVARPLEYLRKRGVKISKIRTSVDFGTDPDEIRRAITKDTGLVVINHVSNVTGTVNDIEAIGKVCREKGIPFLVDASQSIGALPIDVRTMNIDMLAFPGHKSIMGPQGTGALYIRKGIEISPLKRGGTGSRSELLDQPEDMPDRFESGTLNVPGIAGLCAGIDFINSVGIGNIEEKERKLTEMLIEGLEMIDKVKVFAPAAGLRRGSVMSMTLEGMDPQDVGMILDEAFDIAVRAGLHCAPDAHSSIGTLESGGTVRISPGYFTSEEEIASCVDAVRNIAGSI